MSRYIRVEVTDSVATVTLNRPHKHNALVPGMLAEITGEFIRLAGSGTIRVIVLNAAGDSFSTGGDLGGFRDHRSDLASYAQNLVGGLNDAISAMIECDLPIVVAVDGRVCGGALGLVLGGDIVLVTERASFTPYYVEVGFSPDGAWTALLPERIGRQRACAVQCLNDSISARQALDWGLAYALVESATLDARLEEICSRLLAKKPGSLASTKRLIRNSNYQAELEKERQAFVQHIVTDEALHGIESHQIRKSPNTLS